LLEPRYAVCRRVCAQCVGFRVSDASGTAGDARDEKTRNATQAAERILAGVFSGTATGSAGAVETQTHHRRRQLRWKRPRDWACAPRGGRARSQRARTRSKQPRRCSGSRLCLPEKPGDKTTSARPSYVARASSKRAERRGCSNRDPVRRPWPQDAPKTESWRCREPAIRRVSRLNNSFAAKELQSVRPLGGRCFTPKEERHGALGSPWKGSETHLLNGLSMSVCLVAGAAISATFAAASGACTGSAPIFAKRGNEENHDARFSLLVRAETRSRYGARAGKLATESSAFAHGSYSHATLRVPDAAMDDSGAAAVLSSSGPDAPRPPSNVQKKRERDANAPSEPRVTRSTPRISPKGDSGSDRSDRPVDARPFPRRPRDGSRAVRAKK